MAFRDRIKNGKIFGIIWWYFLWPLKWGVFLKGTYNAKTVPYEFCEIIVYRATMCRECMDAGKCINCGCKTPDNFMALANFCAGGNWDQTTIEQWKEYKQRTGLKFEISYAE